ncbi:MAG: response regulator transcription factor [Crocinitomicaceae bacterium]|nr:response regulator transcription factor [Crocinitomicaceae bacterium]
MNNTIVLVEDEQSIAEAIQLNLELESYRVNHFNHGKRAIENIQQLATADLIILDIMLPEVNGIDICKEVRKISDVPILFISAKGTSSDKIEGLKSGGTDYLGKPFDLEELLLRVQILIGRNTVSQQTLTIGGKTIDFKTYIVTNSKGETVTELTKREIALLQLFSSKEGEVVSRDEILDKVWGIDQFPTSRTIDNFILSFRKLFEENSKEPNYFHSIRGVGYKFTLVD